MENNENDQKFNRKKNSLRSSKILNVTDISGMIGNLKLKSKFNENDANEIFMEIDKELKGEISINQFIQTLVLKSKNNVNEKYSEFYLSAINFYLTPSEQIIETIKTAIHKLEAYKEDAKIIKELEWVIQTLSEKDLFDFRLKDEFLLENNLEENDILKFLSEYSNDVFKRQKNQDLESINTIIEKKKKLKDSRRSSLLSLSSSISEESFTVYPLILPSKSYSMINIDILRQIDDISFNIFKFQEEVGRDLTLPAIANFVFISNELTDVINFKNMEMFLTRTRLGYNNNAYHNDIHAADVLHTIMIMGRLAKIVDNCGLTKLDLSALFVAGLLHDVGHPGLSNTYHMNKMTKLALRYNDKSVLENYHCYEGFKILTHADSNILEGLEKEEQRIFRKRVVESILATDMSQHTRVFSTLKYRIDSIYLDQEFSQNKLKSITSSDDKISKFDKQQDFINFLVHTADISNPAKTFDVYSKWTDLVLSEFFAQGDLEKSEGLPISFLCDRSTTSVPKSQIGFINSIVWPLFKVFTFMVPEARYYEANLEKNCEEYKKQLEITESK